jgi:NAD(P)-dependent dehydrogenase (short-subunit alcohol dehydrogenase family)
MEIFDLSGRIAIVTGGNQGIGFSIARGLASAGATVVIANRRVPEGQKAAESLKKEGLNALAIPVDVSNISSIKSLVSKVINDYGEIDILVNDAGIQISKPAEELSEEEWDHMMNVNLKGLFFCCQLVGQGMIKRKKGKIINISSIVSKIARPGRSIYATTKAGVSHLTRSLALEWAKYNIDVNAIAPGLTLTDINKKYFAEHRDELNKLISSIPKGREAYTSDYVGAAIFFASDASDYITGQVLFVDGGTTIL